MDRRPDARPLPDERVERAAPELREFVLPLPLALLAVDLLRPFVLVVLGFDRLRPFVLERPVDVEPVLRVDLLLVLRVDWLLLGRRLEVDRPFDDPLCPLEPDDARRLRAFVLPERLDAARLEVDARDVLLWEPDVRLDRRVVPVEPLLFAEAVRERPPDGDDLADDEREPRSDREPDFDPPRPRALVEPEVFADPELLVEPDLLVDPELLVEPDLLPDPELPLEEPCCDR